MAHGSREHERAGSVKTLIWDGKSLELIDQRKLPFEEVYIRCRTSEDTARAIKDMVVRGAPAIGVTAAYGAALAALEYKGSDFEEFLSFLYKKIGDLSTARPTAVNLLWALERMNNVIEAEKAKTRGMSGIERIKKTTEKLTLEAQIIENEDVKINIRIGENAVALFKNTAGKINAGKKLTILTHCNAGALATAGYGTALGAIRALYSKGFIEKVIVDETRPYLQGARLTAWELYREKIPFFVITDNMSGYFMSGGEVDAVMVGADRIAANGDSANKIGTLSLSIIARFYDIPFYIAAPFSTIDMSMPDGSLIPIEHRPELEVREVFGKKIMPDYMPVSNPSFDVTPNENISGIITERAVIFAPLKDNLEKFSKAKIKNIIN